MKFTVSKGKSNGKTQIDVIDIDFDTVEQAKILGSALESCGANIAWRNQNEPKKRVCILVNQRPTQRESDWIVFATEDKHGLGGLS